MASCFSCPELPASEIASVLTETRIFTVSEENLTAPTADFCCALYSSILSSLQTSDENFDGRTNFDVLQLLDNLEYHAEAIDAFNLYLRMKEFLQSISFDGFTLSDILMPEPRRMSMILSAIVNFLFYREEKLATLQMVMDKLPATDNKKGELEEMLADLKKKIIDYEVAQRMEEPMVHEVEAEVNKLKQSIQDHNKQQMFMRNQSKELKEKTDAIDGKISQADFELLKMAEENSKLLSEVVQSPCKLQRVIEERRRKLAEVTNSERVAMQNVQEISATLEVYLKASEKMSKLLSKEHATQDQVSSARNMEKDVKALKGKLSDYADSIMSLEAKVVELKGKAKHAEDLLRGAEKERNIRHSEAIQKLNNVRTEVYQVLKGLESRERKLEDMIARSDSLHLEADSVSDAEKMKQQKLLLKMEEIVHMFHSYSNRSNNFLLRFEASLASKDDIHRQSATRDDQ